ncbi:MAG: hypothetical protein P1U56_02510 [Saprospiraceae bacterium]|nr:hypothetical protein [Saprospiraceae bacterium]
MAKLSRINIGHIAILVMLYSTSAFSQFEGGEGDGAQKSSIIQITLNGEQINPTALYRGGNGDGADKSLTAVSLNGDLLAYLYSGGNGDGNSKEEFEGTLQGNEIFPMYLGGIGDGNNKNGNVTTLDGNEISTLYLGGDGDGQDKSSYIGVLDGQELAQMYRGGAGDGASKLVTTVLLDGQLLSQLFQGGNGDGATKNKYEGLLDGVMLSSLYMGGNGDGFSKHMIQYIFDFPGCTFVVNTDDDGFGSLRYAIDCAAPGDTIDFSPLLLQDSIVLTSGNLDITKDIFVNGIKTAELTVDASQVSRVMNVGLNTIVTIKGLKLIVGGQVSGGAALNSGILTFVDIDIYDPANTATSVIQNTISGSLTIRGLVTIQEN